MVGGPADIAGGIKPGDVLCSVVNGASTVVVEGLALPSLAEVIKGRARSRVTLGLMRSLPDGRTLPVSCDLERFEAGEGPRMFQQSGTPLWDCGVGVVFSKPGGSDNFVVTRIVPGCAGERCKIIEIDDVLLEIVDETYNGSVLGMSMERLREAIMGRPGTLVTLKLRHEGSSAGFDGPVNELSENLEYSVELERGDADWFVSIDRRQREVEALKAQVSAATSVIVSSSASLEEVKEQHESLTRETDQLRSQLADRDRVAEELERVQDELTRVKANYADCKDQLAALTEEADSSKAAQVELENNYADLKARWEQEVEEHNIAVQKCSDAEEQLRSAQRSVEELTRSLRREQETSRDNQIRFDTARRELESDARKANAEISSLRRRMDMAEADAANALRLNRGLQAGHDSARSELASARLEAESEKDRCAGLRDALSAESARNEGLRRTISALETERRQLNLAWSDWLEARNSSSPGHMAHTQYRHSNSPSSIPRMTM